MSANDVRKNFVFKKEVAQHLKELANRNGKSMTLVVQELIEKEYEEISIEEKLEAFYNFAGSTDGLFEGMTIQSIKASMGDKGEKYGD
ncbi:MAG: hypothetical protein DRG78_05100 [Epsilonproteobacteria bacterium]|nr:MAG: hypothetical protein DRG78_05100 [Campylobacterota bacterium]